ncbi:GH92 family glycosyl hydrolase [Cohnella sp. GCM10027633]|uniref:GH92 family glycosyl hydrolase n=1 Tax=unclassified Cohnella TaxID=2636738 RepID=UPI00363FD7B0
MKNRDYVDYVNPYIGSIGQLLTATTPNVALPHGMAQVAPVTTPGIMDRYLADRIHGFQVGCVSLMATCERADTAQDACASGYDHDFESASPHHYSVLLEDADIWAEYTVTEKCAYFRFSFPERPNARVLLRMPQGAAIEAIDDRTLSGNALQAGVPHYVHLTFSRPFESCAAWTNETDAGVAAAFKPAYESPVEVRVGLSYVSAEQARRNLHSEIGDDGFEQIRDKARTVWNEALGRIGTDGGSEEQRSVFYTALYRSLLPMIDITEDGRYYSGFNGQVNEAGAHAYLTMDNLWDSYRCLHPLQLLLEPSMQSDMIMSYVRMFEQHGWLPQFPALHGDRPYMTGNHAAAFVLDTYAKGERNFDLERAYAAVRHNALNATMLPWTDNQPLTELDRVYAEQGFFPALKKGETEWVPEVDGYERRQAVSVTLEHAYDDWCVAQLAIALGYEDDYALFMKRASNYKNVYDSRIGFMAPKSADGEWVEGFDPKRGGGQGGRDYFAECNSWIYTFHVQHDIEGLIGLMGGTGALAAKLDALFVEQYGGSKYEFLNQFPDATGLIGQYCQGNEPAFHIPYLYNYAGQPWKTQRKVREIMKLWFGAGPLGICGDEDAGALSSWYAWSAIGLYPTCPGKPRYDIGSPIFEETRLRGQDGRTFTIRAIGVSDKNKYIQSAELNGAPHDRPWLAHEDVARGGTLILRMGDRPNKSWGTAD